MSNPHRLCLVTRESRPAAELIRFVLDPEGAVVPDVTRQLPGRGAWVRAEAASVDQAVRRNLFARAFKQQVAAPADLSARIERLLVKRALATLGLARKAGLLVAGFEKVRSALAQGGCALLVEASDAAEDGQRKLMALAERASGRDNPFPVVNAFSAKELGEALGQDRIVHLALRSGRLTDIFQEHSERLVRYRRPWPSRSGEFSPEAGDRTNANAFAGQQAE